MLTKVRQIELIKQKASRLEPGVVTRHTVLINERARLRGAFSRSRRRVLRRRDLRCCLDARNRARYRLRGGRRLAGLTYDHRDMDGATVARALAALERVLNKEIRDELTGAQARAA